MMLILAITSAVLELMIAAKVPFWRRLSAESGLFNLLNSLVLSYIMGLAFGASGLIAMGAGVISTVLTVPGYKFLHWNYDSPKALALGTTRTSEIKSKAAVKYEKTKEVTADVAKVAYVSARIVTAPIWITRKANKKYKAYKVKYSRPV
jgi:hypothetical protein